MSASATALAGRRVLVVEDDYMIAMDMAEMLQSAGATVIGPVGDIAQAAALLDRSAPAPDLAILDLDLLGSPSYPIADLLVARGVPFVFTTGYSAEAIALPYRSHARLEKPVGERALLAALRMAR